MKKFNKLLILTVASLAVGVLAILASFYVEAHHHRLLLESTEVCAQYTTTVEDYKSCSSTSASKSDSDRRMFQTLSILGGAVLGGTVTYVFLGYPGSKKTKSQKPAEE
jgi:hypothetical protein